MKLILCDLNMTLSANMREVMAAAFGGRPRRPFGEVVKRVEAYRPDLIRWLVEAQDAGWSVELFTVRDIRWKQDTLLNLAERTGFAPQDAWFNDTGRSGKHAADVKRVLLERAVRTRRPDLLFAIESNAAVHRMFRECGVVYRRFRGLDSLPAVRELDRVAQAPRLFKDPDRSSPPGLR